MKLPEATETKQIIPNEQGNRTTPSYVAFTDTERLVGEAAKNQVPIFHLIFKHLFNHKMLPREIQ